MDYLASISWAIDKIAHRDKPPVKYFCENCDRYMPTAQMIEEEDPQIPGLRIYFCSSHCCSHWMERDAQYWS